MFYCKFRDLNANRAVASFILFNASDLIPDDRSKEEAMTQRVGCILNLLDS